MTKAAGGSNDGKFDLSDMAYEKLMALVIDGTFPVHSRLPSEVDLAARFGISRPVLRVALERLRADGILRSSRGSGNFVIRQPHQTILDLTALSQIPDIQNCFKFRVGIEGEAAYYAAINCDEVLTGRIDAAFEGLKIAADRKLSGVDADFNFHMAIAEGSRNPYLTSSIAAIRDQFVMGASITHNLSLRRARNRLQTVEAEHQAIRNAVVAGDPEIAREAMRTHIENARKRLFEGDLVVE